MFDAYFDLPAWLRTVVALIVIGVGVCLLISGYAGRPQSQQVTRSDDKVVVVESGGDRASRSRFRAGIVVAGVGWLVNEIKIFKSGAREYQDTHSAAKIVGKTAEEIVALYGEPVTINRDAIGTPDLIIYKDVKHGQYCSIGLKDGVAVSVSFHGQ